MKYVHHTNFKLKNDEISKIKKDNEKYKSEVEEYKYKLIK
jgi:hypothetical protein